MKLNISVNSRSSRTMFVSRLKERPKVGDEFEIIDKANNGKPIRVQLKEIKHHYNGGGEIYCVETVKT